MLGGARWWQVVAGGALWFQAVGAKLIIIGLFRQMSRADSSSRQHPAAERVLDVKQADRGPFPREWSDTIRGLRDSKEVVWIVVPRTAARNTGRTGAVQAPGRACEATELRWRRQLFQGNARKKNNRAAFGGNHLGRGPEQPP